MRDTMELAAVPPFPLAADAFGVELAPLGASVMWDNGIIMVNRGIAPLDPTTSVGQLRLLVGDIDYVELVPPEAGYGDYFNFSDDELTGFLLAGGGSITRASGHAYLRLAAMAASGAISWKSDDLSVDAKQVATEYRLLANIAFGQADIEDAAGASVFLLDHPYNSETAIDYALRGDWCGQELAAPAYPCATPVAQDDGVINGGTP